MAVVIGNPRLREGRGDFAVLSHHPSGVANALTGGIANGINQVGWLSVLFLPFPDATPVCPAHYEGTFE